jgi:hypothetical protein
MYVFEEKKKLNKRIKTELTPPKQSANIHRALKKRRETMLLQIIFFQNKISNREKKKREQCDRLHLPLASRYRKDMFSVR